MTHPRLNFARLLAEFATTLLGIYESKHCHTQDLCMSIRPATVVDLLRLHIVYWSRPFVFYRKNRFFSSEPNFMLIICGSPSTALSSY